MRCRPGVAGREATPDRGGGALECPADAGSTAVAEAIKATLLQDPTIDGVVTISAGDADSAANGTQQAGRNAKVKLGSFDINETGLDRSKEGSQLFAIDQQPWLQGFLAVSLSVRRLVRRPPPRRREPPDAPESVQAPAQTSDMSHRARPPFFGSALRRPEAGSFLGLATVFAFFAVFGGFDFVSATGAASWLNVAASLGIVALPIGLLMIAGERDISIGSMVPAGSMTIAIVSGHFHAPILVGIVVALAIGALVGFINGVLVARTAVPSFIVTLGTLFAVAGLVLGLSVILTGTTSVGIKAGPEAKWLLGHFIGGTFQVTILWWIAAALVFGFVLHYSHYGNWILAMGGDKVSARNAGIPTERVTILLFMCSSVSAAFVGRSQAILYNSAQVSAGQSYIFNAIIAVVVGGVLLTGGSSAARATPATTASRPSTSSAEPFP